MNKQRKKHIAKHKFFAMIFAILFLSANLYSANHVRKIEIGPLNRAIIHCTDIPDSFISSLSDDKTKITITLPNTTIAEEARKISGEGIIEDIYSQKQDTALNIMIILGGKRGYTATMLPYTKSILVESFNWEKLNKYEDDYRSGLLAYEKGIYPRARVDLENAMLGNIPDVGVFLGLIYLRAGELDKALESFITAKSSGTELTDVYAGLSQVYSMKGDTEKASHYRNLFKEKTGVPYFNYLDTSDSINLDIPLEDRYSLLAKNDLPEDESDTTTRKKADEEADSARIPLTAADSAKTAKSEELSEPSILIYVVVVGLLIAIVIISSYIRWRKKQLRNLRKTEKKDFEQKLTKAKGNIPPAGHVASKYQSAAKQSEKTRKAPSDKTRSQKTAEKKKKENYDAGKELKKLADRLKQQKNKSEYEDTEARKQDFDRENLKKSKINAKLELAMHLQKEQQKLKKKNIESMKETDIPTDVDKLSETAKKLGIEKGSIEANKALKKLASDKESISKLADKFSKKRKE